MVVVLGAAATVAGLVLQEARRIPEAGQVFAFHGFRFEVLERQRNQIRRLKITPLAFGVGRRIPIVQRYVG